MYLALFFGLFGGLGLFLYGMFITEKALQKIASNNIKKIIEKYTKTAFYATILGVLITVILQSSGATTVILISFINAGLISLKQSIGIIYGANIGTTVTVQIISFKLEQFALPLIGAGVCLGFFVQNKIIKTIGNIILGFGIIFLGLMTMKDALVPFKDSGVIQTIFLNLDGTTFTGFIIGFSVSLFITSMIHASGATIGIIIALASAGLIHDVTNVIPMILGAKTGSCVTAFMVSYNSNRDGKRIAIGHLIYNITATLLTIIFFKEVVYLIKGSSESIVHQIANAHTFISIVTTAILLPFSNKFAVLLEKIMPIKKEEATRLNLFDYNLIKAPVMAIASVRKSLLYMAEITSSMLEHSCDGIVNKDFSNIKNLHDLEKRTDHLRKSIDNYIMEISQNELSGTQAHELNSYREIAVDLERIGDLVENISDSSEEIQHHDCCINKEVVEIVKILSNDLLYRFELIYKAFENSNVDLLSTIIDNKRSHKKKIKKYIDNINEQIKEGRISPLNGMLISEILYNLERISTHQRRIIYSLRKI